MNNDKKYEFSWPFFGNQHIIDFLQAGISNNSLAHFYIFSGPQNLGKATLTNFFARSILCQNFNEKGGKLPCGECVNCKQKNHNDIFIVKKEEDKKNISIEQIRGFIKTMSLGSFSNSYKIGIIKDSEDLSIEASNALLKTLEEPKKKVIIILLTSFLEKLPVTIKSRSQTLLFKPVAHSDIYDYLIKEHDASRDFALNLSKVSAGRPALALKLLHEKKFLERRKEIALSLVNIIKGNLNKNFFEIEELIKLKKTTQESREETNVILEIWQSVVRDLIMIQLGLKDLVVNEIIMDDLKDLSLKTENLIILNNDIEKSKDYLLANVNPKLILENITIRISS